MVQPPHLPANPTRAPLEAERITYERELPRLLDHAGQFVLIGGTSVLGVFDAYDAAMAAGYARFGVRPFLVHQIERDERVHYLSRAGW